MPDFSPTSLVQATGGTWCGGEPEKLSGFCFDARQLESGECFIALSGGARDGHDFVAQAKENGAAAAIVERPLQVEMPQLVVADSLLAMGAIGKRVRSNFSKPVVGITGSCGKTSTKEMLRLLLGEETTHATAGNWNNRIGVPMTLFGLEEEQDFAVIEAGINQPGEMALLGEMIAADLTILTNIGPAHLELLGSLEGIAAEKSKLAEYAAPGSPLILPADALQYPPFAAMLGRCIVLAGEDEPVPAGARRVVRFASKPIQGGARKLFLDEHAFTIHTSSEGIAANAALALIAAQEFGIDLEQLTARIGEWMPESTRGRIVSDENNLFYIDCYNANPASMKDALAAFVQAAPEEHPRCFVLGAMNELGTSAEEMHAEVGRSLSLRSQDLAFFVGPEALAGAYREGAISAGAYEAQLQSAENIDQIKSAVADFSGALFLKGSRSYQLERLLPESIADS